MEEEEAALLEGQRHQLGDMDIAGQLLAVGVSGAYLFYGCTTSFSYPGRSTGVDMLRRAMAVATAGVTGVHQQERLHGRVEKPTGQPQALPPSIKPAITRHGTSLAASSLRADSSTLAHPG